MTINLSHSITTDAVTLRPYNYDDYSHDILIISRRCIGEKKKIVDTL